MSSASSPPVTAAVLEMKLTVADWTPGAAASAFCTALAQPAHVIPSTWSVTVFTINMISIVRTADKVESRDALASRVVLVENRRCDDGAKQTDGSSLAGRRPAVDRCAVEPHAGPHLLQGSQQPIHLQ